MTNEFKNIKIKILNDNSVTTILESLECENIKSVNKRIECMLPQSFGSKNSRACQIYLNETLSAFIRNRSDFVGKDIFDAVSFLKFNAKTESELLSNLYNAKKYICELLGYEEFLTKKNYKPKVDYLSALRELQTHKKRKNSLQPNRVLPEIILEDYLNIPYYWWIQEGISLKTQNFYQIGFDLHSNRITIPIRNKDGQLVGVKGRIIDDELSDKKYMYLENCSMSEELFNFHIAKESIKQEKKILIFEAEKSCMLMHSNNILNTVAIGSSSVSDTQAKLIKSQGIDVKIVICFDKDKTIEDIKNLAKTFGNRPVYAIFDTKGLLSGKQSPVDCGIEVFKQLESECCYLVNGGEQHD